MKTTTNFGFSVPELFDKPDITPVSQNFEKLDNTLNNLGGGFVLMEFNVPVVQRKKDTMYTKIDIDYGLPKN